MVKTVTLKNFIFYIKSLISKKAGTNLVLLSQLRNMVGQFKKAYLHSPISIIHFLTAARIQKSQK